MPARPRRSARRTILLVGEGKTEVAFLGHLKSLYIHRGRGISARVSNAHGKGPGNIVSHAISQCRNADYDRVLVLLDADIVVPAKVGQIASSKRIRLIQSYPCIEGLLLEILGESVPDRSSSCKEKLDLKIAGKLTIRESYQGNFSLEVLNRRRRKIPILEKLLSNLLFED